jgi:hypothetical protein
MRSRKSPRSAAARWLILALLLLAGGPPPVPARAQAGPGAGPTPSAFDLHVALGESHTSNPGLRSDTTGSEGDFITGLRADFTGRRKSPRTEWSAMYDPSYTRYRINDQFDTVNHALNFDARYLVTRRSRLSLLERFFYSRNPLQIATTGPTDEAIILTRQTKRWRSLSDAAIDTSLSRSLTFQAGASTRIERFDLSSPVDIDTSSGRVGIQKKVGREDSLASTLSYSRFNFHREGTADAEAQEVELSWTHGVPTRTDWALSAGISKVARGDDRQNRLTAGALLHHPFRRLDFVSGYRRSLGADSGVVNVTVGQNAYAGVSGRVGQVASLEVRGEYGTRDSVLESGDRIALTYTGGAIHGAIALNPRLSISGEARRRKQDVTAGAGEDLTVDTFFLGMVFQVF